MAPPQKGILLPDDQTWSCAQRHFTALDTHLLPLYLTHCQRPGFHTLTFNWKRWHFIYLLPPLPLLGNLSAAAGMPTPADVLWKSAAYCSQVGGSSTMVQSVTAVVSLSLSFQQIQGYKHLLVWESNAIFTY